MKLGKGAYGIVWRATEKQGGQRVVALKKIFDAFQNSTDAQRTFREVMLLQQMKGHANIISLLHVMKVSSSSSRQAGRQQPQPQQQPQQQQPQQHSSLHCYPRLSSPRQADNDRDLYLVFEYMDTDLNAAIKANILEDVHQQYIMYQVGSESLTSLLGCLLGVASSVLPRLA